MLRGSANWWKWDEEDVVVMARLLGPMSAESGFTRPLDAIARIAAQRGVRLSSTVAAVLDHATRHRAGLRPIVRAPDAILPGLPRTYHDRLFRHQRVALAFALYHNLPGHLLADAPGVGKTPVAILYAALKLGLFRAMDVPPEPRAILVVTLNAAKEQWKREILRWTGSARVSIVEGTIPEQQAIIRETPEWVVGHWESLVHARQAYLRRRWDLVILDEADAIGNRKAERSKTAFALDAGLRLALTGHPYANSPEELYSILRFLYPDRYTSFWRFFGMHVLATPKPFGGFEVEGLRKPKLLRWEIEPFTLRRTRRQVYPSLPALTRPPRYVALTKSGGAEYARLRKELFVELAALPPRAKKVLAIPSILARVTRLRQYLVDPGLLGAREPSVKYPAVRDLLDEVGAPVVVFTEFKRAALRLGAFLAQRANGKRRVGFITGGLTSKERERARVDFLGKRLDVLIVVTKAGGAALNLGRFGYLCFLDLPWTARALEQAEGRVDRPEEGTGKMVKTTAYRVLVKGTYEDRQPDLLERKHQTFQSAFSTSRRDLEALFAA